jgi:hypothetical protein
MKRRVYVGKRRHWHAGQVNGTRCLRRDRQDTSPDFFSSPAAAALLPNLGLFLGFPAPKDRSHFFVNSLPVHTSHCVNYRLRLLLGFLDLWSRRLESDKCNTPPKKSRSRDDANVISKNFKLEKSHWRKTHSRCV